MDSLATNKLSDIAMYNRGNKRISHQKVIVILLGISFSLLTMELGLRLAGFLFVSFQEYKNRVSSYKEGAYRIVCLGESTTAGQYPRPLEEILNQRNIGVKFSVIDKGIVATNTSAILTVLEENLNKYKPDMVVAMMGYNDKRLMFYKDIPEANTKLFQYCRIYRFIRLMYKHVLNKLKKEDIYGELFKENIGLNSKNDKTYFSLGALYLKQGKLSEAEELWKKAIELNPKNDVAYSKLGWLYLIQGKLADAEELWKKAIEINSKNGIVYVQLGKLWFNQGKFFQGEEAFKRAIELSPGNCDAYNGLGMLWSNQGKFSQAEEAFKKAIESNPQNVWVNGGLAVTYMKQGKLSQAEEVLKKLLVINNKGDWIYRALENLYREMNKIEFAEEYKKKRDELRLNEYGAITINNYRKLKEILDQRGIRLVCVQYPMRSLEPLKKIFEGERGVVFVDNERVFKEALKRGAYTEYFLDLFAGDFGHCTPEGNRILAENIANGILKEVFSK